MGEKRIDESKDDDCTYPRRVLELIIDKFTIGLSNNDENPLMKVPYEAWDGKIFSVDAKDMRLCQPTEHKETIMRMYTLLPEKIDEAREDWTKHW